MKRCWHADQCSARLDGDLSNRHGQLARLASLLGPKGKPCPNGHKRDNRNFSGSMLGPNGLLGLQAGHVWWLRSYSVMQSASVTAIVLYLFILPLSAFYKKPQVKIGCVSPSSLC